MASARLEADLFPEHRRTQGVFDMPKQLSHPGIVKRRLRNVVTGGHGSLAIDGVSGSWLGTHRIAPPSIAPIRRDFLALAVLRKRPV
jgi:hypothetical protein